MINDVLLHTQPSFSTHPPKKPFTSDGIHFFASRAAMSAWQRSTQSNGTPGSPPTTIINNDTNGNSRDEFFHASEADRQRRTLASRQMVSKAIQGHEISTHLGTTKSTFHTDRKEQYRIVPNSDDTIDHWPSTSFHANTPRAQTIVTRSNQPAYDGSDLRFKHMQDVIYRSRETETEDDKHNKPKRPARKSSPEINIVSSRASESSQLAHTRTNQTPVSPVETIRNRNEVRVLGRVVRDATGQVRRGEVTDADGNILTVPFYRVAAQRADMSSTIPSIASSPSSVSSGATTHTEKERTRVKKHVQRQIQSNMCELVPEHDLLFPDQHRFNNMSRLIDNILNGKKRVVLWTWRRFCENHRKFEKQTNAAYIVQRFMKRLVTFLRINARALGLEYELKQIKIQHGEKQVFVQQEKYYKLTQELKRKTGVTEDGIHFFWSEEAMKNWFELRNKAVQKAVNALSRMIHGTKQIAFKAWFHFIKFELGRIHYRLADERINQRKQAPPKPLYPGTGVILPGRLPGVGTRLRNDGTLEVLDIERYNTFKKSHKGPTDRSSWLVNTSKTKILFGAYPLGQARLNDPTITTRSSSAAMLLLAGINTFVNFVTPIEDRLLSQTQVNRTEYRIEVVRLHNEIRAGLVLGVTSCNESLAFAKARADRGREVGYGESQQTGLDRVWNKRKQDSERAIKALDDFPEILHFWDLPTPFGGVSKDTDMLDLCQRVEEGLSSGSNSFYIFSSDGHGRACAFSALLLGRLFGLIPADALDRIQRHHDVQLRFDKAATTAELMPCIPSMRQRNQVVRLLQITEPSYDSVIRRGDVLGQSVSLAHFPTRRNQGLPVLMPALFNHVLEREAERLAQADINSNATMDEIIAKAQVTPRGVDEGEKIEYAEVDSEGTYTDNGDEAMESVDGNSINTQTPVDKQENSNNHRESILTHETQYNGQKGFTLKYQVMNEESGSVKWMSRDEIIETRGSNRYKMLKAYEQDNHELLEQEGFDTNSLIDRSVDGSRAGSVLALRDPPDLEVSDSIKSSDVDPNAAPITTKYVHASRGGESIVEHEAQYSLAKGFSLKYKVLDEENGSFKWILRDEIMKSGESNRIRLAKAYEKINHKLLEDEGFDTNSLYDRSVAGSKLNSCNANSIGTGSQKEEASSTAQKTISGTDKIIAHEVRYDIELGLTLMYRLNRRLDDCEIWVNREDILRTQDETLIELVKTYELEHHHQLEAEGFDTRSAYDAPLLGKATSFSILIEKASGRRSGDRSSNGNGGNRSCRRGSKSGSKNGVTLGSGVEMEYSRERNSVTQSIIAHKFTHDKASDVVAVYYKVKSKHETQENANIEIREKNKADLNGSFKSDFKLQNKPETEVWMSRNQILESGHVRLNQLLNGYESLHHNEIKDGGFETTTPAAAFIDFESLNSERTSSSHVEKSSKTSNYERFLDAMSDDGSIKNGSVYQPRATKLAMLQMKNKRFARPTPPPNNDNKPKRKKYIRRRRQSEIDRDYDAKYIVAQKIPAPWDAPVDEILSHECKYNFTTGFSLMFHLHRCIDDSKVWVTREKLLGTLDPNTIKMVEEYEARNRETLEAEGFESDVLFDIPALEGNADQVNGLGVSISSNGSICEVGGPVPLLDKSTNSVVLPKVPIPVLNLKEAKNESFKKQSATNKESTTLEPLSLNKKQKSERRRRTKDK